MNLEYYRVFYYVSKMKGITAAAQALCISQPAVSQAIRQMETELGVRLFVRTSKGVHLTKEGELLSSYVQKGLEQILDGEEMLRRMQNLEHGEVRIGASDMTLRFYLLPFLEQFHESYPGIKVIVSNAPTPETMKSLQEGKIDFGVVTAPVDTMPHIEQYPVRKIEDIFVAGDKFRELEGKRLNYSCLEQYPCIMLEEETSTRAFTDQFLRQQQTDIVPEFELATSDMIVQFALKNLGIGCVVADFAREKLDSGELFQLQFGLPVPKRQMCIVVNQKTPISLAGKRLLENLLKDHNKNL